MYVNGRRWNTRKLVFAGTRIQNPVQCLILWQTDRQTYNLQALSILTLKLVVSDVDVGNGQHIPTGNITQSGQHRYSMRWQRILQQRPRTLIQLWRCVQSLQTQNTTTHCRISLPGFPLLQTIKFTTFSNKGIGMRLFQDGMKNFPGPFCSPQMFENNK